MNFYSACRDNDLKQIKTLIAAGVNLNARGDRGWTPTYIACYKNNVKALKVLIAAGADPNASGTCGWTPAHLTCVYGNVKALELLITAGVALDAKNNNGQTARNIAENRNSTACLKVLRQQSINVVPGPDEWISGDLGLPEAVMREVMTWLCIEVLFLAVNHESSHRMLVQRPQTDH